VRFGLCILKKAGLGMQKNYRQGDVILVSINPPESARAKEVVLAEGELSGHAHRITKGYAVLHEEEYFRSGQYIRLLECRTECELTHEEHHKIILPMGLYHVSIQREFGRDYRGD
jgi:hypothetical protein